MADARRGRTADGGSPGRGAGGVILADALRTEARAPGPPAPRRAPPDPPAHGGRARGRGVAHGWPTPSGTTSRPWPGPRPTPSASSARRSRRPPSARPRARRSRPSPRRCRSARPERARYGSGVKRRGRCCGPQMPKVSGFHVTSPSTARSRQAPGQDGQRLLQLGPGQGGAEAVVDAAAEGQLRRAGRRLRDVEGVRLVERAGVEVGRREAREHERARREQRRPGTRCPPRRSAPSPGWRPCSASTPRPTASPGPDAPPGAPTGRDGGRTARPCTRAGCGWCRCRRRSPPRPSRPARRGSGGRPPPRPR